MLQEVLLDTVKDSVRLLPFLFFTYFLMEWLEHRTGKAARDRIRCAGAYGPVWGGLLGIMPQCGFSAAAASLYAGRVITVGTLIAVFLSTSDEMLPILVSRAVPLATIGRILAVKCLIAIASGLAIELIYLNVMKKTEKEMNIHVVCEEEHCNCGDGLIRSAVRHTLRIFFYIMLISLVLNLAIASVGEDTLTGFFTSAPVIGVLTSALVGLIPNCASSVVVTELYLGGIISAGSMMAGLLVNAGIGILVLLRLNRNWKQNACIIGVLYALGVFWGMLIETFGIVF